MKSCLPLRSKSNFLEPLSSKIFSTFAPATKKRKNQSLERATKKRKLKSGNSTETPFEGPTWTPQDEQNFIVRKTIFLFYSFI